MSGFEILAYLAIYGLVMIIGVKVISSNKKQAPIEKYTLPYANQNYERPILGAGLGPVSPRAGYVKNSTQKKAS